MGLAQVGLMRWGSLNDKTPANGRFADFKSGRLAPHHADARDLPSNKSYLPPLKPLEPPLERALAPAALLALLMADL